MHKIGPRTAVAIGLALLMLLGLLFFASSPGSPVDPGTLGRTPAEGSADSLKAPVGEVDLSGAAKSAVGGREIAVPGIGDTGVRGIVVDARTGAPLPGVEVVAMRRMPSIERLESRFRGLFQSGLWQQAHQPVEILGSDVSAGDGRFQILGLFEGRIFLDGRSDAFYVRTPGSARLAQGEVVEGIELRGTPGGRVRGVVLSADGAPAAGAVVSLRPGLNAFLGQLTERKYRWIEARTDDNGRFDMPGVPTGTGYVLSASSPHLALEEVHGLEVQEGRVTHVTVRGHPGALVGGRVLDGDGRPVAGANVAMVYLDVSRVLFSADGREEPVVTDETGSFLLERVASGRVAFLAAADGLAPSSVQELAVVDGGVYRDLELRLGEGVALRGRVVDQDDEPVVGAWVELRPMERPRDSDFLKMALRIRRIEVETDGEGGFVARGLAGDRLLIQAGKPGYTTTVVSGLQIEPEEELRLQLFRGVTIHGRVASEDGEPVTRFSVEPRSRPEERGDRAEDPNDETGRETRIGFGSRDGGGRGWERRWGRQRVRQLPEGEGLMDRGTRSRWREFSDARGAFEITGLPPGRIRVHVRAEGYLDTERQEVVLEGGQRSDELLFVVRPGVVARGRVIDSAGAPVSDAQVAAYRTDEEGGSDRGGLFRANVDPEDFDFLGFSSVRGRRSAVSDMRGEFEIDGLRPGTYRFTARHPDLAKASARDVEVLDGGPTEGIEIRLETGGGVEGVVTGSGQRPLPDALIVAFSMSAGSLKSSSTDGRGFYRIDGLPPGQYVVFKSRMDERSDNLGLDLMSNMRLKTVTVREGRFTRLDIHDESEEGVRVYGTVRENGQPIPRALVTALGTDRDGFLGMGVRANAADSEGRYELVGIEPGSYLFQISTFRGRPVQASVSVDVPYEVHEYRLDLEMPQGAVSGRVVGTDGSPVSGARVSLGVEGGDVTRAGGMLGLIARNGVSRARTDDDGRFEVRNVAAGTYRITVSGRRSGRDGSAYGGASLEAVTVDGLTPVSGLQIVLPLAGRITGLVLDGSGNPVTGAEVHCADQERRRDRGNALTDLFGVQERPVVTGADGSFEIPGLTPGTYTVRADAGGLETGIEGDVVVSEGQVTDVTLRVVRGATLQVRVTNIERERIPLASISVLDGEGRPVVRKVSTMSILRRFMSGKDEIEDTGWHEFGSVPPDTYTVVVREEGEDEIRVTRTIADGETVQWDIDLAAEIESRRGTGK